MTIRSVRLAHADDRDAPSRTRCAPSRRKVSPKCSCARRFRGEARHVRGRLRRVRRVSSARRCTTRYTSMRRVRRCTTSTRGTSTITRTRGNERKWEQAGDEGKNAVRSRRGTTRHAALVAWRRYIVEHRRAAVDVGVAGEKSHAPRSWYLCCRAVRPRGAACALDVRPPAAEPRGRCRRRRRSCRGSRRGRVVRGAELGYPDEHHLDALVRSDAPPLSCVRMLDFFSPSSTFTASRVPAGPHDPAWIIFTSVMAMWMGKRRGRRVCDEGARRAARGETRGKREDARVGERNGKARGRPTRGGETTGRAGGRGRPSRREVDARVASNGDGESLACAGAVGDGARGPRPLRVWRLAVPASNDRRGKNF